MRFAGLSFCVLSIFLGTTDIGQATETVLTPAKGPACKERQFDPIAAREHSERRCPGPRDFSIKYFDFITQGGVVFNYRGNDLPGEDLAWHPSDAGIGSHIEWRFENGVPSAAIIARWRGLQENGAGTGVTVEEILVAKVTTRETCVVAVIAGLSPQAMVLARQHADERVHSFRCRIDKPFTSAALSYVSSLDGRLAKSEIFDHNGSVVELTRSRSGTVEISYRVPKRSLAIPRGTLLFRGSEHNGVLSGDAFVFKDGCSPAPYAVSGKRAGIYLFLEGTAPRRGAGCAVIGASKTSNHARLVFERDPVLNVSDTSATRQLPQTTTIPLEQGYYVIAQEKCGRASNATITLFDGTSFGSAHSECKKPSVRAVSMNSYTIVETCRTTQVDNGAWATLTSTVDVRNRTSFVTTTPAGKFHYRYCKQSDLPEPWSNVDLQEMRQASEEASLASTAR